MKRQSEERLKVEKRLRSELRTYFTLLERQIQTTITKATEQGIPTHNIEVLIDILFNDWHHDYTEKVNHYHQLIRRLGEKQYKELVEIQQRKALHKSRRTHHRTLSPIITLNDDPVHTLAVKATITGDEETIMPYSIEENPVVTRKLEQANFQFSEKTRARVNNDIHQILKLKETDGLHPREVGKLIQQRFTKLKGYEAERIARTECNRACNTYRYEQLLNDDLIDYNMWLSQIDSRTRGQHKGDKANHIEMNGEIVRCGDTFSNGLRFPHDPMAPAYEVVNCRCTLVPYILPWDRMAPPGMSRFHESDLIPRPMDENQQFMLEALEDTHLLTPLDEEGLRVEAGNLRVNGQQIKQALQSATQGIISGTLMDIGGVQDNIKNALRIPLSPLQKNKQLLREMHPVTPVPITEQLERKSVNTLTHHLDNQLDKYLKTNTRYEQKIEKLQEKQEIVSDTLISLDNIKRREIQEYLDENFDNLLATQAKLSQEEQLTYNKLLKELEQAGVDTNQEWNDEFKYLIMDKAGWGLIQRHKFKDLHKKAALSMPQGYKKIIDDITDVKRKLKTNPTNPNFKSKLEQLEAQRRIYIKRNTPESIREEARKVIDKKYEKQYNKTRKLFEKTDKQIMNTRQRQRQRLKQIDEKIGTIETQWVKTSEKQGIKLSSQVQPTQTITVNGKQYHNYNDIEDKYADYRKLSSRLHGSKSHHSDLAEFYTDDSGAFNQYVALKRRGASREELRMVLEDEFHKIDTGYSFHGDKYEGVHSIDDLERLFNKREKEMFDNTIKLEENTMLFSAQNAHYITGEIGDSIPMEAFTSTSLSEKQILTFVERLDSNDKPVAVLEIAADAGSCVTPMLQSGEEDYMNEAELVLPPGFQNEIVDIVDTVIDVGGRLEIPAKKYLLNVKGCKKR